MDTQNRGYDTRYTLIIKEIFDTICKLMREKISVRPGFPLFGVVILGGEAENKKVFYYLIMLLSILIKFCRFMNQGAALCFVFHGKCDVFPQSYSPH